MNKTENPWRTMQESSQRRVDFDTIHNLFWITDMERRYGFYLQSQNIFNNTKPPANLKGISILKRNSMQNFGELFLVLNKKEEWQIFYTLCQDLISITHKYESDKAMISAVETRLRRWQQLLTHNVDIEMDLERQMGLFSELSCLKQILIPKVGVEEAVISWVGADFDKQDFLLKKSIIEIKSYRTSKSPIVEITSLQQLYSDTKPLYLLAYALTQTSRGNNIGDLVEEIYTLLDDKPMIVRDIFEKRLLEYGYIPEIQKSPLFEFAVDRCRAYLVSDRFPKILPYSVANQILSVSYSIDLIGCEEFVIDIENINIGDIDG